MKKYKIYAKILGYVLPNDPFEIGECKIEKMSYREQLKRGFKPLAGLPLKEKGINHITFPTGIDSRIMRSNFVVHTLLECANQNEAIGAAEIRFNKLIGILMLYIYHWWLNEHPEKKIRFSEYDYQICKAYEIVDNKEIEIKELGPVSSGASMCHFPAFNKLTGNFKKIVDFYFDCKDENFQKSLIYFTNGIRGFNSQLPEEKVFLDLFKSIELIINGFKRKKTSKFKTKLKNSTKYLKLTSEEQKTIIKFYDIRSRGDFAHAKGLKRTINFPPQYPNPGYCEPFVNYFELIDISQKIIINYAEYIKDRYIVTTKRYPCEDAEEGLNQIHTLGDFGWEIDFVFVSRERNRRKITASLKKQAAKEFNVKIKQVKVLEHRENKMILKIFR